MRGADADPIERWNGDRDLDALAAADRARVRDAVLALAAESEAAYPAIDEDRLLSTATALRVAGHGDVDRVLGAYLARRPDAARLDVTACLLRGLWQAGSPHPGAVRALLRARAAVPFDESADASAVLALAAALEAGLPDDLRAEVTAELAAAARRSWRHPGVGPVLARVLGAKAQRGNRCSGSAPGPG